MRMKVVGQQVVLLVLLRLMTKSELYSAIQIACKIISSDRIHYADAYGLFHLPGGKGQVTYFIDNSNRQKSAILSANEVNKIKKGDYKSYIKTRLKLKKELFKEAIGVDDVE